MSCQGSEDYAASAMRYLNMLCDQLERNEPLRMPPYKWFVQAAAPVALGLCVAACSNSGTVNNPNDKRTRAVEICDNGIDDDKNGAVDCDDQACGAHPHCMVGVLYAAPPMPIENDPLEDTKPLPSDPSHGSVDPDNSEIPSNDSEQRVDCRDPRYQGHPECGVMYAGPPNPSPAPPPAPGRDGKTRPPYGSDPGYPPPAVALYAAPPDVPGVAPR